MPGHFSLVTNTTRLFLVFVLTENQVTMEQTDEEKLQDMLNQYDEDAKVAVYTQEEHLEAENQEPSTALKVLSFAIDIIPFAGTAKTAIQIISGKFECFF